MNGQVLRDDGPRLSRINNTIRDVMRRGSNENDYNACLSVELSKAEESCSRMMVHVQEG